MSESTDWGKVEQDVIAHMTRGLEDESAVVTIASAVSEGRADTYPKGYTSIFTVSDGTVAARSGKSGGGYIQLDEDFKLTVIIYAQDGRSEEEARFGADGIHALAAKVKGAVNGYTPNYQIDSVGCLELRRDEPAKEYGGAGDDGSVNYKIRQVYLLKGILRSKVTGDAIAA